MIFPFSFRLINTSLLSCEQFYIGNAIACGRLVKKSMLAASWPNSSDYQQPEPRGILMKEFIHLWCKTRCSSQAQSATHDMANKVQNQGSWQRMKRTYCPSLLQTLESQIITRLKQGK
jgi:hypothetical protein